MRRSRRWNPCVRTSPGNPTYRANLATALYNFANLQMLNRDGSNFWPNYERSRDLLEGLVREFPSATPYSKLLISTCGNMGVLCMHSERFEEARVLLGRVREIGEGLVRDNPDVPKYRSDLAKVYINLSDLENRAGRPGKAVDLLRPACDLLRQVVRSRGGDGEAREAMATACVGLAISLVDLGRHAEALPAYRECVELELKLVRNKDPRFPPHDWILQTGLLGLARCYRHLGRVSEAAEPLTLLAEVKIFDPVAIPRELMLCSLHTRERLTAEGYVDRSIDLLRKAVATRARDVESLRTDPAFNPLRSRPDFQDLLADAAFPNDPFAR